MDINNGQNMPVCFSEKDAEGRGILAPRAHMVSVVIPFYNSNDTIKGALSSLVSSIYKDIEVIVADDCSDNGPDELIGADNFWFSVKIVRLGENKGPGAARNAGARAAAGGYLFFMDADTEIFPNTISEAVNQLEALNAHAVTGVYDSSPLNTGLFPEYKALLNNYFFSRKGVFPYEVFDSSRACIRRDLFISLGGFNENLTPGLDFENEEFGYRLTQAHRNYLVPSVRVRHHFPYLRRFTASYFLRVSMWAEIFLGRKRFESGGVTSSDMGLGTAAVLPALILPFLIRRHYMWIPAVFFLFFIKTYAGFYLFSIKKRGGIKGIAFFFINIYASVIITCGAVYGAVKFLWCRAGKRGNTPIL